MVGQLFGGILLAFASSATAQEAPAQGDDLAGRLRVVPLNDELLSDLAVRNDLGTLQVLAANWGVNPYINQTREGLVLPTAQILPPGPREGIVINRAEYRLYYFQHGQLAFTAPVAVGEDNHETPLGQTAVMRKQKDPVWHPTAGTLEDFPGTESSVPPGPENPLGTRALYLKWPTYLIHGAADDFAIGRRLTRGCVRLYAHDIERLFDMVPVGTPVSIIDQPIKLGWHDDELFVEAEPSFDQLEELRLSFSFTTKPTEDISSWITTTAGPRAQDLDWPTISQALARRSGIPTQITRVLVHPVEIGDHGAGF